MGKSKTVYIKNPDLGTEDYKPEHDIGSYKDFGIVMCEHEIIRIDKLMRAMKQCRKEYIKIQNELKSCTDDTQARRVTTDYPAFEESFEGMKEELLKINSEHAEYKERMEKIEAFEEALEEQGLNEQPLPGFEVNDKVDITHQIFQGESNEE